MSGPASSTPELHAIGVGATGPAKPAAAGRPALTLAPGREIDATSVAGPTGPSTAGLMVVVLLLGLAAIGAAGTVRRRLDPRCRAEATFFDRAGIDPADRRSLRRAAHRMDPPLPAPSLLLSPGLLDAACRTPGVSPGDAAALQRLARRRFGAGPATASSSEAPPATPPLAVRPRSRPAAAVETTPHRGRAVSLLAVAMAAADDRRAASPEALAPPSPAEGAADAR